MSILAIAPSTLADLRDCAPAALRLSVERSGANLIVSVANRGRVACMVSGLPVIAFIDRHGRRLPIVWRNPFRFGAVSLGHGPVVIPAAIPSGGRATSVMSLAPPPAGRARCTDRAIMTASWEFQLRARLSSWLCYAADGSTTFGQTWLETSARLGGVTRAQPNATALPGR